MSSDAKAHNLRQIGLGFGGFSVGNIFILFYLLREKKTVYPARLRIFLASVETYSFFVMVIEQCSNIMTLNRVCN